MVSIRHHCAKCLIGEYGFNPCSNGLMVSILKPKDLN